MTVIGGAPTWFVTRRSFDALVERVRPVRLSVDEAEFLGDTHWRLGEDALLREDLRFRSTPWGRWILSDAYLANDALCAELHRAQRPTVDLEQALAELDRVVGRQCVVCPADPRLVIDDGEVRLSARELSDHPLVEPEITDLERYVTHLPLHSLRAAAASEPAGQWGRRAQDQVIETLGWLKIAIPGRRLNRLMFVAQIEGQSMDDGKSGLVDGAYAVFELWPAGTKQNLSVLVRGAFTDPETGSYAVKKYVADVRGADGRHRRVQLVSLNPDRERFPDIALEPTEDDDVVTVVAKVVHALTPSDFARQPRQQPRRGRRDISSTEGRADITRKLEEHAERFFGAAPPAKPGEAPRTETWAATLVCLDAASGGPHLEVGPLGDLRTFVKKIQATGTDWDALILASNVRERPVRIVVPPSRGPWRFTAVGFEDELDLSMLDVAALDSERAHVFRVDAEGVGRHHQGDRLSPGQRYRVLVSGALIASSPDRGRFTACGAGWLLWELELARPVPADIAEAVRKLGLAIGEPSPALEWVAVAPVAWRVTARGESYACFAANPGPVARVRECHVEVDGEAVAFLHGPSGTVSHALPVGETHLVHLGALEPGRYVLAFEHHRTAVAIGRAAFEIIEEVPAAPPARADLTLGDEVHAARSGEAMVLGPRDLADGEQGNMLASLRLSAPPGWPVRIAWREVAEETLERQTMGDDGGCDGRELLQAVRERLARRPIGDVVVDLGELGRLVLAHQRERDAERVRARLAERIAAWGGNVERFEGRYEDLLRPWFEPVCAALGFEVERLPEGEVADPPEHAVAFRLDYLERRGPRIDRQPMRLLVLVERLAPTLSPAMLTWIGEAAIRAKVREVLISDGWRWAAHKRTSRLALQVWDLRTVMAEPEAFASFLHVASEGV